MCVGVQPVNEEAIRLFIEGGEKGSSDFYDTARCSSSKSRTGTANIGNSMSSA